MWARKHPELALPCENRPDDLVVWRCVRSWRKAMAGRGFFLDTRFIRTPEKTPTTPLIERGAKTPGKKRED